MSKLLDAASQYAQLGYRVFPCRPGAKLPLTQHGFQDATTDLEKIQFWWSASPNANIGLATEGLVVIDCDDTQWPVDADQRSTLASAVAIAQTPRGGRHYVFRRPAGVAWRCSASRLAIGVDVRTDGGYIVVAPSVTDRGGYLWLPSHTLSVSVEQLSLPPQWLHEALDAVAARMEQQPEGQPEAGAIPSGSRNVALTRIGGVLRRAGMTEAEIAAALLKVNQDRCRPPLGEEEVRRIASSVARYEPDPVTVAHCEDHFGQVQEAGAAALADGATPGNLSWLYQPHSTTADQGERPGQPSEQGDIRSIREIRDRYTHLRAPVIHGLLREGEVMNVIAAPKTGKSWLVSDLALSVAGGTPWLGLFDCEQGNVLIVDNELHPETIASRFRRIMEARGIDQEQINDRIDVVTLRGQLKNIMGLSPLFKGIEPGKYRLVIIDAFYRILPPGVDENDNGAMAQMYNVIDLYAARLKSCFVLVHHTSKGVQSNKGITDVGAGAGSQARAADTHFILRQHEMPGVVVIDGVVRSWPPVQPRCLRWDYPLWHVEDGLDPTLLKRETPSRRKATPPAALASASDHHGGQATPEANGHHEDDHLASVVHFVESVLTDEPKNINQIVFRATRQGFSPDDAANLLQLAINQGLVTRCPHPRSNLKSLYKRSGV